MKQLLAITTGLLLSYPLLAGSIDQTLNLGADCQLQLELQNGSAEIVGWDKNKVQISGTTELDPEDIVIELDGNNILIQENTAFGGDDKETHLKIFAPRSTRIEAEGVNVRFVASKFDKGTAIETMNGSIEANECQEHVSLESINGSITTKGLRGNIEIETINGSINDKDSDGRLELATVNGSITSASAASVVQVETVNSAIDLTLEEVERLDIHGTNARSTVKIGKLKKIADINIESVSGGITLALPKAAKASIIMETQLGGRIRNNFSEHKATKEKRRFAPNGSVLKLKANGGGADVRVTTLTGTIKLEKN
jgi:ribosomal protein L28